MGGLDRGRSAKARMGRYRSSHILGDVLGDSRVVQPCRLKLHIIENMILTPLQLRACSMLGSLVCVFAFGMT